MDELDKQELIDAYNKVARNACQAICNDYSRISKRSWLPCLEELILKVLLFIFLAVY